MITQISVAKKAIEALLSQSDPKTDWARELKHFKLLLAYLQHERMIHLLVTLTVGLATLISTLTTLMHPSLPLIVLDSVFGVLFIAYIIHYYRLENATQSCYPLITKLQAKL